MYIIQFRNNSALRTREQELFSLALKEVDRGAEYIDIYDEAIDWEEVARRAKNSSVIFAGSGDFDFDGARDAGHPARLGAEHALKTIEPLLSAVFDAQTPTLGICFGHQLLARFCGAQVFHNPDEGKVGTYTVHLEEEATSYPLFRELPESFDAHFAHKDSVIETPKTARVLGRADRCGRSILGYSKRIYGVQFHPEIPDAYAHERLGGFAESMERSICAVAPIRETGSVSKILTNFLRLE